MLKRQAGSNSLKKDDFERGIAWSFTLFVAESSTSRTPLNSCHTMRVPLVWWKKEARKHSELQPFQPLRVFYMTLSGNWRATFCRGRKNDFAAVVAGGERLRSFQNGRNTRSRLFPTDPTKRGPPNDETSPGKARPSENWRATLRCGRWTLVS